MLDTRFSILETRYSILDPRSSILDARASRIEDRVSSDCQLTFDRYCRSVSIYISFSYSKWPRFDPPPPPPHTFQQKIILKPLYMNFLLTSRVLIRRRDPGTSTRIQKSQYLPTFKLDIKKFTSSDLFCPPTLL